MTVGRYCVGAQEGWVRISPLVSRMLRDGAFVYMSVFGAFNQTLKRVSTHKKLYYRAHSLLDSFRIFEDCCRLRRSPRHLVCVSLNLVVEESKPKPRSQRWYVGAMSIAVRTLCRHINIANALTFDLRGAI